VDAHTASLFSNYRANNRYGSDHYVVSTISKLLLVTNDVFVTIISLRPLFHSNLWRDGGARCIVVCDNLPPISLTTTQYDKRTSEALFGIIVNVVLEVE
jgi:hypothetical protein